MKSYLESLLKGKKGKAVKRAIENDARAFSFLSSLLEGDAAWCSLTEAARYIIRYGRTELPKCVVCGKTIKVKTMLDHPNATMCSLVCARSHEGASKTKERVEKTFMERYGVSVPSQLDWVKEKVRRTTREHYGVDFFAQSEEGKRACRFGQKKTEEQLKRLRKRAYDKAVERTDRNGFELMVKEDDWRGCPNRSYDVRCKRCGRVFRQPFSFSYEMRCPFCDALPHTVSSGEKEVRDFLMSLGERVVFNDRSVLKPLELDVYLPERKLAVEFDGLYWHSDRNGCSATNHLFKTEECLKRGISLVHVFEDEWREKRDIVKSRLTHLVGGECERIFARKCEVREVEAGVAKRFVDRCHLQGSCIGESVRLGLFYGERLVSVMTFGRARYRKDCDWEILRYCVEVGVNVVGGAGKLFSRFLRGYYSGGGIVSYSDRRWGEGVLYERLGFVSVGVSQPAVWYVKGVRRYSRFRFQKRFLKDVLEKFDETQTELENMRNNGYACLYDCGNRVFVYDSSRPK